ncbi:calpain-like protease [Grosmannia clavigera kw1407]|uniref:Calpain-like protease n=1 Tax=Grosmannia clavigera (strain kw1407 / UAMH 11150) TaxID=655863 RepID=F0XQK2_GROCL|nr:calpain-like protease [Grosmannia clavigera kw1407]EFX00051.1 calpain-like protease [Grosmannia clavigera kw1407]
MAPFRFEFQCKQEREALASQSVGQTALDHVITAVELYMKAVQEATSPVERSRLRRKCKELMAHGERLKAAAAPVEAAMSSLSLKGAASSSEPKDPNPRLSRELSKKEQIILLRSSRLHGSLFPPWETEPPNDMFSLSNSSSALYEDNVEFSMSKQQYKVFAGWRRPAELFPEHSQADEQLAQDAQSNMFMLANQEPDLVQDITTDCSVVASICAIVRHTTGHSDRPSLLSKIMYPYDHSNDWPLLSENGKYVFRMFFNGAPRRVVVDDRLPSSTSRTLFVVDRQNPTLLWPALLEKAYLKVHGGYDFPGSNSGTDLWVLTGWIPEQIFIQSKEEQPDLLWERIKKAYDSGDVMLTLGTGRLSAEEEGLGLAGEHDYAVLDIQVDMAGNRRMLVKNPWCDNLVWRGIGISPDAALPEATSSSTVPTAAPMTGTFWIGYEDILQYYETLYLSWNPSLFSHCQHHHFSWTLPSKAAAHSLAHNPQYAFQPADDGTVWILLNRHFQDADLDYARQKRYSEQADKTPEDAAAGQPGYIALYVFAVDGQRVQLPDRPRWTHRVPLVDSPQTLLRFEGRRAMRYTAVVEPAVDALAYYQEVADEWSMETAGGSAASPDFVRNPQYALTVPTATPLSLLLCAESDDVPLRVDLVWARGRRVASLAVRDLVVSSGEYHRGSALALVMPRGVSAGSVRSGVGSSIGSSGSAGFGPGTVDAGTYTVVVSTFERGQQTRLVLRVGSAVPVTLQPIPAEDSGKLRTSLESLMLMLDGSDDNGDGNGNDDDNTLRWKAVMTAPRLSTRVSLIVQAVERAAGRTSGTAAATTTTAAAAAAASTTLVRVSVERVATSRRARGHEVLASTGNGQLLAIPVAGLRIGEISLGRASSAAYEERLGIGVPTATTKAMPEFRIVVEARSSCSGRRLQLRNVGIRVDVLSTDRVQIQPWTAA